ncbi:sulfur carrier protein [Clostridium tetanomorphum]|uniref:Sulfur carrier protein ThiS n=1 Tax=Clostridium tetanomorphum TaxID=1553 RepID=A0A923J0J7_CLOTT|nr:sulfur carrier protein ThiS [Clostridium tetanomorphum]KAJ53588.1 thiamine biosynthesis protein ThiS [Clostridium tetanomorphum DSM 665]MBC2397794.1 sulfur carrier protein ThiS [Clostridium tetanomorphum]MBP1864603.1 sulfur carrier protein [Clostridium tetanomorphum]NRS84072.1 sulfur carrier protein [Clostridium tetanomorphum]NRZ97286.1 sulfur carrier protein [Clostridium tetanomorphum]
MIKVNGKQIHNANGISLYNLLINEGYSLIRIVVELNGEIISKSQYNQINIKDGDSLEVVSFVGGG